MPRLNSRNECTVGYLVTWFDDDRMILWKEKTPGKEDYELVLSDGTKLTDEKGISRFYAGYGLWVAFRATPEPVLFGPGFSIPKGALVRNCDPIGPDGSIAYKPDYHGFGPWQILNLKGEVPGEISPVFGGDCQNVANQGGGKVIWTINWIVDANFDFPWKGVGAFSFRYKDGHFLWQSSTSKELVLDGYVIGPPSDEYFRPDFNITPTGFFIVWSKKEGEIEHQELSLTFDELKTKSKFGEVAKVDVIPIVPAYERKLWIAPFYSHSERYGDTPAQEHCGNAVIVVDEDNDGSAMERTLARVKADGFPIIADANHNLNPVYLDQTVAYWAGNAVVAQTALKKPEKPVIWYEDVDNLNGWPATKPSWVNDRVWPAMQVYRKPNEPMVTFEARVLAMLGRVSTYGNPMFLVPRFDDFNGTGTIAQTIEAMGTYRNLISIYPIIGFLPFSDRRGNGIAKNPELKAWATAFELANPARPNRYDYWTSSGDTKTSILNKLGQSTSLITLTDREKDYIRGSLQQTQVDSNKFLAPNELATVEAVIAAHPEIDTKDEDSLDKGRAVITDWAAQRLNKKYGKVIWGRKSRGRPTADGKADRPNTDSLTYLRPDGLFEIYDIITGGSGKATWGPTEKVWKGGENGYWCPPQLGPES